MIELIEDLTVESDGPDLVFSWGAVTDPCLTGDTFRYRIYAGVSAVPADPPGAFPDDPAFVEVGATSETTFRYSASTDDVYFIVVAVGTDGLDGATGHYPAP